VNNLKVYCSIIYQRQYIIIYCLDFFIMVKKKIENLLENKKSFTEEEKHIVRDIINQS